MSRFRSFWSLVLRARSVIGFVLISVAILWSVEVLPVRAAGGVNHQINYQGRLLDSTGQPVSDASYQMKFTLYDAVSGGTALWTASGTTATPLAIPVTVSGGLFTIALGDTSVSAGSQNALTGIDWNQDGLYLGVTVSPDIAEMTPRKRLTAVPQAFNAEQLQGMYASSSIATGSLFVINQADNGSTGSTRTALEVRTQGLSDTNDFLIRGINNQAAAVFSVNRTGSVTSTASNVKKNGRFSAIIDSSTNISVATSTPVGTFGGVVDFQVRGRYGYVMSNTRNFEIVDLSGVNGVGSLAQLGSPYMRRMDIAGNFAYAIGSSNFMVIDISRPTAPTLVSTINPSGGATAMGVQIQGTSAFIFYDAALQVLDIADPYRPRVIGTYSAVTKINNGWVQGSYAYLADRDASLVRIIDIHDPSTMAQVGTFGVTNPSLVVVEGSLMAVTWPISVSAEEIIFVDVSNPSAPVQLGTYDPPSKNLLTKPVIRGRYFYASTYDTSLTRYEVDVLDIGNPRNPVLVQNFVPASGGGTVEVAGNTLFTPSATGIDSYLLYQAEVTGMKAHLADIGSLQVRDRASFEAPISLLAGGSASGGFSVDRLLASASGTQPTLMAVNTASTTRSSAWGAYINTLLVGGAASATGTANYRMVLGYNAESDGATFQGICLDDLSTAKTCPTSYGGAGSVSLIAEGSVTGGGYDLAERYDVTGEVSPGDVLTFDPDASGRMHRSAGIPYDPLLSGIASTQPGFILGIDGGVTVALAGRVPTRVSPINGTIAIGDPLTSSMYPGVAMKATQPGRIIGYALAATTTTSTIEVFVRPGYEAGALLATDGTNATLNNHLVVTAQHEVTADAPTANSWGLSFRGRAWDGAGAVTTDYLLGATVFSATSSEWSIRSGSSTLFALDQGGNARVQGDLFLGGKLFPSARGNMQTSKYLFLDDRAADASYIATNADGWQANDSYDFAERYYSPDHLTAGDVVVVSQQGRFHVQRSLNTTAIPMGIVSTRPGFVAGAAASSTYPIALAGRVPTKVTATNGAIQVGDLLAPSTIPGVAMKATAAGPVVGQALEAYSGGDVGSIEVFVHVGWWGGPAKALEEVPAASESQTAEAAPTKIYQGLARIVTRGQRVHVQFPSVGSYPLVQVTPYGEIDGTWWTDHYTHEGFDILLKKPQEHELTFAWRVEGMTPEQSKIPISDGTIRDLDVDSGQVIPRDSDNEPVPAPAPPITEVITTTTESIAPVVTPPSPPTESLPTEDVPATVTNVPAPASTGADTVTSPPAPEPAVAPSEPTVTEVDTTSPPSSETSTTTSP